METRLNIRSFPLMMLNFDILYDSKKSLEIFVCTEKMNCFLVVLLVNNRSLYPTFSNCRKSIRKLFLIKKNHSAI